MASNTSYRWPQTLQHEEYQNDPFVLVDTLNNGVREFSNVSIARQKSASSYFDTFLKFDRTSSRSFNIRHSRCLAPWFDPRERDIPAHACVANLEIEVLLPREHFKNHTDVRSLRLELPFNHVEMPRPEFWLSARREAAKPGEAWAERPSDHHTVVKPVGYDAQSDERPIHTSSVIESSKYFRIPGVNKESPLYGKKFCLTVALKSYVRNEATGEYAFSVDSRLHRVEFVSPTDFDSQHVAAMSFDPIALFVSGCLCEQSCSFCRGNIPSYSTVDENMIRDHGEQATEVLQPHGTIAQHVPLYFETAAPGTQLPADHDGHILPGFTPGAKEVDERLKKLMGILSAKPAEIRRLERLVTEEQWVLETAVQQFGRDSPEVQARIAEINSPDSHLAQLYTAVFRAECDILAGRLQEVPYEMEQEAHIFICRKVLALMRSAPPPRVWESLRASRRGLQDAKAMIVELANIAPAVENFDTIRLRRNEVQTKLASIGSTLEDVAECAAELKRRPVGTLGITGASLFCSQFPHIEKSLGLDEILDLLAKITDRVNVLADRQENKTRGLNGAVVKQISQDLTSAKLLLQNYQDCVRAEKSSLYLYYLRRDLQWSVAAVSQELELCELTSSPTELPQELLNFDERNGVRPGMYAEALVKAPKEPHMDPEGSFVWDNDALSVLPLGERSIHFPKDLWLQTIKSSEAFDSWDLTLSDLTNMHLAQEAVSPSDYRPMFFYLAPKQTNGLPDGRLRDLIIAVAGADLGEQLILVRAIPGTKIKFLAPVYLYESLAQALENGFIDPDLCALFRAG